MFVGCDTDGNCWPSDVQHACLPCTVCSWRVLHDVVSSDVVLGAGSGRGQQCPQCARAIGNGSAVVSQLLLSSRWCDVAVCCLSAPAAVPVFKLLEKYRPETKSQKVERLKAAAETKAAGSAADDSKRPRHIKYGLNHITYLVENQKAGLVVIASDVDPIEVRGVASGRRRGGAGVRCCAFSRVLFYWTSVCGWGVVVRLLGCQPLSCMTRVC